MTDFIRDAWHRKLHQSSAPAAPAEDAPPPASPPASGFGGGPQGVAQPEGESLNDAVRRRVFGEPA